MICEDLAPLLTQIPLCRQSGLGAQFTTHCLYPSSDPVQVYVQKMGGGFFVSDGGGAMRSALAHGKGWNGVFEKACKRHSVSFRSGTIVAEPPTPDWLMPAVLAVSNASAMAARLAVESAISKSESSLRDEVYEGLRRAVPEAKIGKDFEYRGRSGHLWQVDFAVREESIILLKSVVQNGNSINSNYAAFGDIGDREQVHKLSVFSRPLAQDSAALMRQVATLVPIAALTDTVKGLAYGRRLN